MLQPAMNFDNSLPNEDFRTLDDRETWDTESSQNFGPEKVKIVSRGDFIESKNPKKKSQQNSPEKIIKQVSSQSDNYPDSPEDRFSAPQDSNFLDDNQMWSNKKKKRDLPKGPIDLGQFGQEWDTEDQNYWLFNNFQDEYIQSINSFNDANAMSYTTVEINEIYSSFKENVDKLESETIVQILEPEIMKEQFANDMLLLQMFIKEITDKEIELQKDEKFDIN